MNKKELAGRVTDYLRANEIRKPISIKKHTFHVSDDDGNSADFVVKRRDKTVIYTVDDTNNIIDACLEVIADALKRGEEINIRGFGVLGLTYRAARRTKQPGTDDWYDVEARHVPKFTFGTDLRLAARVYDLSLQGKYDYMDDDLLDDEDGGVE